MQGRSMNPLDWKIGDRFTPEELAAIGFKPERNPNERPDKGEYPAEWFVAFGGMLGKAKEHLDILGLHHFQPMHRCEEKSRHTRNYANPKDKIVERQLFPGYLFVEAGKNVDLREIDGIWGFLMDSETRYSRVRHQTILDLQKAIERRKFDDAAALREIFHPGAVIAIRPEDRAGGYHVFGGFRGKIEKVFEDKDVARILLDIFGRATPVEMDLIDLEAV